MTMTSQEEWVHSFDSGEKFYPYPMNYYYQKLLNELVDQLKEKTLKDLTVNEILQAGKLKIQKINTPK